MKVLKSVNDAIDVFTLPGGEPSQSFPYSSILVGNGVLYLLAAPEGRNYQRLVAINSNELPSPFKGKTFVIQWKPTSGTGWQKYFNWYFSGFGLNPNGLGANVKAGIIEPIINFFPSAYRGSYADYWGNLKRSARFNFIVKDVFGQPLDNPIQATKSNVDKWNAAKNEYLSNSESSTEKVEDLEASDGNSIEASLNADVYDNEKDEDKPMNLIWIILIAIVVYYFLNR